MFVFAWGVHDFRRKFKFSRGFLEFGIPSPQIHMPGKLCSQKRFGVHQHVVVAARFDIQVLANVQVETIEQEGQL